MKEESKSEVFVNMQSRGDKIGFSTISRTTNPLQNRLHINKLKIIGEQEKPIRTISSTSSK